MLRTQISNHVVFVAVYSETAHTLLYWLHLDGSLIYTLEIDLMLELIKIKCYWDGDDD